jgi:hypothetical protein
VQAIDFLSLKVEIKLFQSKPKHHLLVGFEVTYLHSGYARVIFLPAIS